MTTHPAPPSSTTRKALAWCVHLYTALGLVADAAIAVLIVRGDPHSIHWAFAVMLLACVIDGTDGTLARAIKVKQVLPGFDGARLDDIVDFLSYTFLPLLLIWRIGILPPHVNWVLLAPLLASAYGFCQVNAKTSDGYFLGFPSYWNVVAFYLYVLQFPPWLSVCILLLLAVLTFVPSRYLYPSQRGLLNDVTALLGLAWAGLVVYVLYQLFQDSHEQARRVALVSLAFPVYYMVVSWIVSIRHWRG